MVIRYAAIAVLLASTAVMAEPRTFAVQVTGHGQPMILIPGLASSGKVWDGTVAHYKDRYECHVLTLAGFAGQPPVAFQEDSFLRAVRDDIIAYIRSSKLHKPILVAHSLGGFLALWIAQQEPDLVGPLVIVDSLPFFGGLNSDKATAQSMKPFAVQMRKAFAAQSPEQAAKGSDASIRPMVTRDSDYEIVKAWGRASDHATVGEALAELFSIDLRPELGKIQSTTLVMGTWIAYKDQTTREQVEKRFRAQYAALPHFELVMSDTAKHFIMLDEPDWFLQLVDRFLNQSAPAPKTHA